MKVIEAKLIQLARVRHPIEVGMYEREARQFVGLQQRKGRTRHFELFVAGEVANERARESRFAAAEIAGQTHDVARFERRSEVTYELTQRLLTRHRQCEA